MDANTASFFYEILSLVLSGIIVLISMLLWNMNSRINLTKSKQESDFKELNSKIGDIETEQAVNKAHDEGITKDIHEIKTSIDKLDIKFDKVLNQK